MTQELNLALYKRVYVFLPHQDDELFIAPLLWQLRKCDLKVVFLTHGSQYEQGFTIQRRKESENFFAKLDSSVKVNLRFLGEELDILDGSLLDRLASVRDQLKLIIEESEPDLVLCPRLEGGHPDHDGTAFLVSYLVASGILKSSLVLGFSLYNKRGTRFFRVIDSAATSFYFKVPRFSSVSNLFFSMFSYSSQRKALMVLGPFLITNILLRGRIYFFNFYEIIKLDRPHSGMLFYEWRLGIQFEDFRRKCERFFASRAGELESTTKT